MKKRIFSLITLLILTSILFYYSGSDLSITGASVVEEQTYNTEVYFSYEEDLTELFSEYIRGTESTLDCALYDIGETIEEALIEKSKEIEIRVIKDDETRDINHPFVKDSYGLMHNKFCIRDNSILWTGSYNPTERGTLNNNNVLVIYSKYAVENYQEEFDEMWKEEFKKGDKVKYPEIIINGNLYETRFCPEDACAEKLLEELSKAKNSIYFMTFSFTREDVANLLKEKHSEGVKVEGLFEAKRRNTQYNKYRDLAEFSHLDTNKYTMHHKVFVIDESVVITGSFNPTGAGDERNDENMLIIHDEDIAKLYVEEFERLTS